MPMVILQWQIGGPETHWPFSPIVPRLASPNTITRFFCLLLLFTASLLHQLTNIFLYCTHTPCSYQQHHPSSTKSKHPETRAAIYFNALIASIQSRRGLLQAQQPPVRSQQHRGTSIQEANPDVSSSHRRARPAASQQQPCRHSSTCPLSSASPPSTTPPPPLLPSSSPTTSRRPPKTSTRPGWWMP